MKSTPANTDEDVAHGATGETLRFIRRAPLQDYPLRRFSSTDLRGAALFPLYAASRPLPPSVQARVARMAPIARLRTQSRFYILGMKAFFGDRPEPDLARIMSEYKAGNTRRNMVFVFERKPGLWRPELSLQGREHLDAALARGRGAVIWGDSFLFQTHVGKRILYENGIRAAQLSIAEHGYSRSRFGLKWFNPWNVRVENRYLGERLVVTDGDTGTIKARIAEILKDNGIVIITNNNQLGYRFVEFSLGAAARLRLAQGAMRLAWQAGAALLPMVTVETDPLAGYAGTIGEELMPPAAAQSGDAAGQAFCTAALNYRAWIEPHLRAHPGQWMNWPRMLAGQALAGMPADA